MMPSGLAVPPVPPHRMEAFWYHLSHASLWSPAEPHRNWEEDYGSFATNLETVITCLGLWLSLHRESLRAVYWQCKHATPLNFCRGKEISPCLAMSAAVWWKATAAILCNASQPALLSSNFRKRALQLSPAPAKLWGKRVARASARVRDAGCSSRRGRQRGSDHSPSCDRRNWNVNSAPWQ